MFDVAHRDSLEMLMIFVCLIHSTWTAFATTKPDRASKNAMLRKQKLPTEFERMVTKLTKGTTTLGVIFFLSVLYVVIEYIWSYPNTAASSYKSAKSANKSDKNCLKMFLMQHNRSTLIKYIREIESSIYFEKISNQHKDINPLYYTDKSPHYYNGEFDLNRGKTCKVLRCAYHCTSHSIIQKAQLNEWTLRINQTQLNKDTLEFLNTLQTKYNIYTNLYQKFISNLKIHNSPYIKPLNIYSFGNSHLKQLIEGTICLMEDIEVNTFREPYNKAILSFYPRHGRLYDSKPQYPYDYNNTICGQYPNDLDISSYGICNRGIDGNGIIINDYNQNLIFKQRLKNNLKFCDNKLLYIKFADQTRHFYHYQFKKSNKNMKRNTNELINFIEHNPGAFKDFKDDREYLENYIKNQDIIIFNVGSKPIYDIDEHLLQDLKFMNHLNKPILLLSQWWDWRHDNVPSIYRNKTRLDKLYKDYPNLIVINYYERNRIKLLKWNKTSLPFHYGKYRWILAEGEPNGHMCQPGVPEHHILALTELINLIIHVYNMVDCVL